MRRLRVSLLGFAGLLCNLVLSGPPAYAGPPASPPVAVPTGLRVHINSVTPSTLRPNAAVQVSGTVTNTGRSAWRSLQAYLVISATPMTTRTELAAAVRSDPAAPIGDRIVDPRRFSELGDLAGGDLRTFSLRVPFAELPISRNPGVYWLGVHVLGTAANGIRDDLADARARTFIPLVPTEPAPAGVDLALVWPITSTVPELRSGVYTNDSLGRAFSPGGRLSDLLLIARGAPPGQLSWAIDPAIVSAAASMATGYVISRGPRKRIGPSVLDAQNWLSSLRGQLSGRPVLTLPYGDPDATSLVHAGVRGILARAVTASERVMAAEQLSSFSTLWPADGLSDRRTLAAGRRAGTSLTLLSDRSLPVAGRGRPVLNIPAGAAPAQTLVADRALVGGGPRPGRSHGALQVRQRLLAETALLSLSSRAGQASRVIGAFPRTWNPGADWAEADFFAGLRVPWLRLTPVTDLLTRPAAPYDGRLRYSTPARHAELPASLLAQTRALRRTSTTLVSLLTDPGSGRSTYDRALGSSASVNWRSAPAAGRAINSSRVAAVAGSLDSVDVQASSFVTLSSSSGRFPVTITNGLRQGITVGLSIRSADPALGIAPVQPVAVESGQRTTITVTAKAERIGVASVTMRPVTADGRPFGQRNSIDVRATQYGLVGWILVGVAVTVLFVTAARRIVRRLSARRAAVTGSP